MYTVTLPSFAGPLDLLLRLIERAELDITAIALAQVADQYLAHVRALDAPEPHALAEFVSLAARLLLIKSHALLPRPTTEPPRPVSAEKDARVLVQQLREYQRYKRAAALLGAWQEAGQHMFVRTACTPTPVAVYYPPLEHHVDDLVAAAQRRRRLPARTRPRTPLTLGRRLTVAEAMGRIHQHLTRQSTCTLDEVLGAGITRQEIVVIFWAVLELLKQRQITAVQGDLFGAITLGPHTTADMGYEERQKPANT